MESSPAPSTDFTTDQRLLLAMAGTVALPSPYPAYGQVFVGIDPSGDDSPASPRFFVKLVQTLTSRRVITRFFALNDLRAVSYPAGSQGDVHAARVTSTVTDMRERIESAKQALECAVQDSATVHELLLYPVAVLHLPEAAAVMVHITQEFGVTAAEAAENVEKCTEVTSGCC